MEVNDALIENLASLACLRFEEDEKGAIKKDLERMIRFVEKLKEVDTEGVEPQLHMTSAVNVFRADETGGTLSREEALRNAPSTDGEYFRVPKVIRNPG